MVYEFGNFGHSMGYKIKVIKHMNARNCDRVKDYICAGYDTFNPNCPKEHPCWDVIEDGINLLLAEGWKVGTGEWKNIGKQVIIESPDGGYYHSRYNHK